MADPRRGHQPGSVIGTRESHRCLEVGWANAANTPFRENKMWVHEGGIATPLIAYWPAGIKAKGELTREVGARHRPDADPLELAGASYPKKFQGRQLTPLEGREPGARLCGQVFGRAHAGLGARRQSRHPRWRLEARGHLSRRLGVV